MRALISLLSMIAVAGCAPAMGNVPLASSGPEPAVSDLGIAVTQSGLGELTGKVSGREDADCQANSVGTVCRITTANELYVFTEADSPAHPAAMFRGFVESEESGGYEFHQRGWFAGDSEAAQAFYDRVIAEGILPPAPMD